MVLKANVRALLNELTLLLGRKKSSGFFCLLGCFKEYFFPVGFCFPMWTGWLPCGKFALVLSQSLSWLQGKNAARRVRGFGVMQFKRS